MSVRGGIARAAGRATTWAMRTLLHRQASTLPGRVALALDPHVIAHLAGRPAQGSVVVCGTNGKTTTTNVLAQAVEACGVRVLCNRAGANMESGVASALLPGGDFAWAVLENDELSTVRIVPELQPRYLVLLNLFRDQLDRCGEIDRVQDVLVRALAGSSQTTLVYNADDPLCEGVARRAHAAGTPLLPFGIGEDLRLAPDRVQGGGFCQQCGAPLAYEYRQYGQLGAYACTSCGFARPALACAATGVHVAADGVSFDVRGSAGVPDAHLSAAWGGTYMVYNLMAAYVAASLMGVDARTFQGVLDGYHPENGRLQRFDVKGRQVVLNLAKNPTGFNQNMALLLQDPAPKAVYVVINDNYNDGKDVSWLWDVDFERMARANPARVFCGGHRANDMQVRLKYAGISAQVMPDVASVLAACAELPSGCHLYVLTNYSALWPAKAELEKLGVSL